MVIHFNVDKLEARRTEQGQSMRAVSRYITSGRSNDTYRLLVQDMNGDCSSLINACAVVGWYSSIECVEYARPEIMRILKKYLVRGGSILGACEVSPPETSGGITEQAGKDVL